MMNIKWLTYLVAFGLGSCVGFLVGLKPNEEKSVPIVEDELEPEVEEDDGDPGIDFSHMEVLSIFKDRFPNIPVKQWWKKGTSTIRIRFNDIIEDSDVIFKYRSGDKWRLETIKMYNRRNKIR